MTALSAGLTSFDARDRRVDELARGELLARDELGLRGRVEEREIVGHARQARCAGQGCDACSLGSVRPIVLLVRLRV